MSKPTLLVLAAGMGSRYGGLKQIDPVGPSGETLLDYSVYDALRAGFGRVVFVIRRDFEREFREQVGRKYEGRAPVDYVFQQLDMLPEGFAVPEGRTKPWGTTHAIWCAREALAEPFAAINADDFYGATSYRQLGAFLSEVDPGARPPKFAMVGFRLGNTLSEHGGVARGVCRVGPGGHLEYIEEFTKIEKCGAGGKETRADGSVAEFTGEEPVSMNFWGFTPAVFPFLEAQLVEFFKRGMSDPKSELYIPASVGELVRRAQASVEVLPTDSTWFGVTYREDKPRVMESLEQLVARGEYPRSLWG